MTITTIIHELWRFIKDKFMQIIIGTLLLIALGFGARALIQQNLSESSELQQGKDAAQSMAYLKEVYNVEPASFQLALQTQDGYLFENSFILDEFFTSPDIVEKTEEQTGVNFSDTLDHEKNLELIKSADYRGSIAGIRDRSSNVITVRVQVAENAEDNLKIAREYARQIMDGEVPLLNSLDIYPFVEPQIGEMITGENLTMVSSPAALGNFSVARSEQSLAKTVVLGLLASIFAFILVTAFLVVLELFKNKITYAFQYSWDFDDQHILIDHRKEDASEWIDFPSDIRRLVLSEGQSHSETGDWQELVLVIQSGQTSRTWFEDNYRKAQLLQAPIKIVHVY